MNSGVYSLMESAAKDHDGRKGHQAGFQYLLDGDLCQMSTQEEFLRSHGFDVGRCNVYPAVRTEEEFKRALRAIWENKVAGWWHYKDKYGKYGICTAEKCDAALLGERTKGSRRT